MSNLAYKGLFGTRLQLALWLYIIATVVLLVGGYIDVKMTVDQWLNFTNWLFGTYAASEGMAKGAEAYAVRAPK